MTTNRITAALCSYLDTTTRPPFDWQVNNCCHFAAGWWRLMTGVDALAGFAMPAGPAAARRLLHAPGASLLDLVGQRTHRAPVPPSFAQVGDLVALPASALGGGDTGTGVALGICCGRTAVLLAIDGATGHVPMTSALCAWPLRAAA